MGKLFKHLDFFAIGVQALIVAIELGSGINLAFVSHALISPAFPDMPNVALAVSGLVGVLFGLGGSALFAKREHAIKAIKAYAEENGESPYTRLVALWAILVVLAGMGILGLVYRLQFLDSRGISWLIWFGVFLEVLPILLSLVLHPMKNKPVELITDEALQKFDREHVTNLYKTIGDMPLEIKEMAYQGRIEEALKATRAYMIEQDKKKRQATRYSEKRKIRFLPYNPTVAEIEGPKERTEDAKEDAGSYAKDADGYVEDVVPFVRPLRNS